jgi:hypothetical protein
VNEEAFGPLGAAAPKEKRNMFIPYTHTFKFHVGNSGFFHKDPG